MKELGSLVPQIFYDLIGRIAPGVFLLIVFRLLIKSQVPADFPGPPASLTATSGFILWAVVISYVSATMLGAIAGMILNQEWSTQGVVSIKADPPPSAPTKPGEDDLTEGRISYMYDALQIYNPAAGARLVK